MLQLVVVVVVSFAGSRASEEFVAVEEWRERRGGKIHLGLRRWSLWAMKIVLRSLVVMALDSEKRILLLHKPSSFVYGVYAKREEDFYSLQKM